MPNRIVNHVFKLKIEYYVQTDYLFRKFKMDMPVWYLIKANRDLELYRFTLLYLH